MSDLHAQLLLTCDFARSKRTYNIHSFHNLKETEQVKTVLRSGSVLCPHLWFAVAVSIFYS